MVVGIPRAFLYYRYRALWQTFFEELGVQTILSPETNKKILELGSERAISEACLSSKVYLGHVASLVGKCDCILVPRIAGYPGGGKVCTKFMAVYDLVRNTFSEENPALLYYNIDPRSTEFEFRSFLKMGRYLGKKRTACVRAYMIAKLEQRRAQSEALREQQQKLALPGLKILIVAHPYNICDRYIGRPITDGLNALGVTSVLADTADKKEALAACETISDGIPWIYNRELVGAVELYRDRVDGIILMTSFPCGPDSLVNEMLIRRVRDLPVLQIVADGQEGSAGLETRLESFVDILQFKKEGAVGYGRR